MVYPALLPLMHTARVVVDWINTPANLNGLSHFTERQNLVSALTNLRAMVGVFKPAATTTTTTPAAVDVVAQHLVML